MKKSLLKFITSSFFLLTSSFAASAASVVPFSPTNGGEFKLSNGGKLTRLASFSPVSNGTVAVKSVYAADVYTNAVAVTWETNVAYTVVYSNSYTHVVTTNVFPNLSFVDDPYVAGISTNRTAFATTNSWTVFEKTVAVTNDVAAGTQTVYKLDQALASPVYLAPGEKLIFSGTALGGWVRLIFE